MANSSGLVAPGPSLWSITILFLSLLQSPVCHADSSSTEASGSSTSSAPASTHTIQVGLADHKFQPDSIQADVGDVVEFRFYPTNHSIVRAEYGFPCVPFELMPPYKTGFFSGFHAVDRILDNPPKYSLKINDTSPVFFYCSAPDSCITYGMVGAINPNTSTDLVNQQQLARNRSYMLNPGESFPDESASPSITPSITPSRLPNPTSTPITPRKTENHGLPTGVIAGIVVAAAVIFLVGVFLIYLYRRIAKKAVRHTSSTRNSGKDQNSYETAVELPTPIAEKG